MDVTTFGLNLSEVRSLSLTLTIETNLPLELPWFREMPGYYNTLGVPMHYPNPVITPGYAYPYNVAPGPPGHNFVIQQGNGPPTITQV